MNIDLLQIAYKAGMVILAFLAAVVITKTLSKYLKLDEKIEKDQEISKSKKQDS